MSDVTAEAPVAELPGDGLRESIVDELRRHIGDALVEHLLKPQDDLWIRVRPDAWAATGRALSEMGFTYFCFLSALDWKPSPFGRGEDDPTQPPPERTTEIKQGYAGGETRFQVFARVTDTTRHVGVTVKADVAEDSMAVDSWHAIYAGANWHERETHEMFGIDFTGHPDLRNMYLPTEFEGFPLRKDFPLLARMVKPWPGIVDVEPMPAEEAARAVRLWRGRAGARTRRRPPSPPTSPTRRSPMRRRTPSSCRKSRRAAGDTNGDPDSRQDNGRRRHRDAEAEGESS